eukprot:CAMPEP_0182416260 /NCGR_PEP_ID=MMETSP1167-20130531/516_1 /TAXON_ID=2988 /ORGANISM="Mallomonas Sp, Strain CCMP3275" /LENGTH=424 /DNA_ID=CAMNT_0024588875 /DNA_START=58 /DNA_END=1332 /DNA_ORIENTATION=-
MVATFCLIYVSIGLQTLSALAYSLRSPTGLVTPTQLQKPNHSFNFFFHELQSKLSFHDLVETFQDMILSIPRGVKIMYSSSLESLLLQCTMPSNTFIDEMQLNKFLSQVSQVDQISEEFDIDAYDVIIRKLMTKMHEADWRTSAKAAYVLHRVLETLSPKQRKYFASSLSVPLDEVRLTLTRRMKKQKLAKGSDETSSHWAWVINYLQHIEYSAQMTNRDRSYMDSLIAMQGPTAVLDVVREQLIISNNMLTKSKLMTKSHPLSKFISQLTFKANEMVAKDIRQVIQTVGSLKQPRHGGYRHMEQGAVDALQRLAEEVRSLLSRSLSLLRDEILSVPLLSSSSVSASSPLTAPNLVSSTLSGGEGIAGEVVTLASFVPSLPGWIHDLVHMKAGINVGPLRLRGGSSCYNQQEGTHGEFRYLTRL